MLGKNFNFNGKYKTSTSKPSSRVLSLDSSYLLPSNNKPPRLSVRGFYNHKNVYHRDSVLTSFPDSVLRSFVTEGEKDETITPPQYQKFRSMLEKHQKSVAPLWSYIAENELDTYLIHIVLLNQYVRTIVTIPGVAHTVSTLAKQNGSETQLKNMTNILRDEAGEKNNHAVLMETAFDTIRKSFALPVLASYKIKENLDILYKINIILSFYQAGVTNIEFLKNIGIDIETVINDLNEQTKELYHSWQDIVITKFDPEKLIKQRIAIESRLQNIGILPETLEYIKQEKGLFFNQSADEIVGAAWAHESQADSMMHAVEKICQNCKHLISEREYKELVAPYFTAHHNEEEEIFTEQNHGKQMEEMILKILERDNQSRTNKASKGAEAYFTRQEQYTNALCTAIERYLSTKRSPSPMSDVEAIQSGPVSTTQHLAVFNNLLRSEGTNYTRRNNSKPQEPTTAYQIQIIEEQERLMQVVGDGYAK